MHCHLENLNRCEMCWSVIGHLNILTFWTKKHGNFCIRAGSIHSQHPTKHLITGNL